VLLAIRWWLALLVLLAVPGRLAAAAEAGPSELVLSNGIRLAVLEVASPEVAVCSSYATGTAQRTARERALAALLFEVQSRVSEAELGPNQRGLAERGGLQHVQLFPGAAEYCTTLPRAEVGFALWLEALRATGAWLLPAVFERAKAELMARLEAGEPAGKQAAQRLVPLLFAGHPVYEGGVAVSVAALEATTFAGLQAFFARRYGPSRVTLSVAGDVRAAEVGRLAERHFSSLRPPSVVSQPSVSERHPQTNERYSTFIVAGLEAPVLLYGWVVPGAEADQNVRLGLEMLGAITMDPEQGLLGSAASRSRLGLESASISLGGLAGIDWLQVELVGARAVRLDRLRSEVEQHFLRLAHQGPTDAELARARVRLSEREAALQAAPLPLARRLARALGVRGEARPFDLRERLSAIDGQAIRELSRQYLMPFQKTLVEAYPPKWYVPSPPLPRYYIVKGGETLTAIAKAQRVTVAELAKANGLDAKRPLSIGQKLVLPKSTLPPIVVHKVSKGDTLSGIAKRYGVSVSQLVGANKLNRKKALQLGQELVIPSK
jgi:LysM repeat protein/predicted Zn-dependent peptidase